MASYPMWIGLVILAIFCNFMVWQSSSLIIRIIFLLAMIGAAWLSFKKTSKDFLKMTNRANSRPGTPEESPKIPKHVLKKHLEKQEKTQSEQLAENKKSIAISILVAITLGVTGLTYARPDLMKGINIKDIISAGLLLIAVALSIGIMQRNQVPSSRSGKKKTSKSDDAAIMGSLKSVGNLNDDESAKLVLLTPRDIDDEMVRQKGVECDCPDVMNSIPVDRLRTDSEIVRSSEMDAIDSALDSVEEKAKARKSVAVDPLELEAQSKSLCFLRQFLAKPHPLVGRPGPVCPFIPTALHNNIVQIGITRTSEDVTQEEITKVIRPLLKRFETLEPREGKLLQYKAILVVFPDIKLKDAKHLIDGVQNMLKGEFVKRGLMIGEFHKNNNTSGLRNESFFPLRTPIPTLAIRHMVTGDLVFLDMDKYEPEARIGFFENYLSRYGDDKKPRVKKMCDKAREGLKRAKEEFAASKAN